MMKKWFTIFSTVSLLTIGLSGFVLADDTVQLIVNGQLLHPKVSPKIVNGRTIAPVRSVAEALGSKVTWDGDSNTVRIDTPNLDSFKQRLNALEPEQPQTILESPRDKQIREWLAQNKVPTIEEVKQSGRNVPFEVLSIDDAWKRPYYYEGWHSTSMGGKHSDIRNIVYYASHNFFVWRGGAAEGSELIALLGGFPGKLSVDDVKPSQHGITIVAIKSDIKEIKFNQNHMVIVVEPKLAGYQTAFIKFEDMGLTINQQKFLLDYVTPEGYELERDLTD